MIGRFVRDSLTLADSAEQRFSLLCAINVPQNIVAVESDRSPSTIQLEIVVDTGVRSQGTLTVYSQRSFAAYFPVVTPADREWWHGERAWP